MASLLEEVEVLLDTAAEAIDHPVVIEQLTKMATAAADVARSWSQSNLGYHASVYYQGFKVPPPDRRFSREWGLSGVGMFSPPTQGWARRSHDEVVEFIYERAGHPDANELKTASDQVVAVFAETKSELESIVSAALRANPDDHLSKLLTELSGIEVLTVQVGRSAQMPSGQMMTRDPTWDGTLALAAHQEVIAQVVSMRSPFDRLDDVIKLGRQVASHLRRIGSADTADGSAPVTATNPNVVFIGHGHSREWLALSHFLDKTLHLEVEEFSREPTPGVLTGDRLQTMLDRATFAFIILTGEDEQADGKVTPRLNVAHEVGLFQGKLGLRRAIVMLEQGCEEFSNIHGLGQIRFDKAKIESAFNEVRQTLEREGVIS